MRSRIRIGAGKRLVTHRGEKRDHVPGYSQIVLQNPVTTDEPLQKVLCLWLILCACGDGKTIPHSERDLDISEWWKDDRSFVCQIGMCLCYLDAQSASVHGHCHPLIEKCVNLFAVTPGAVARWSILRQLRPAPHGLQCLRLSKGNSAIAGEIISAILPKEDGKVID